jgi:hypothetical protein
MLSIARIDVVTLQVQGDVAERVWIAINVQGPYVTSATLVAVYLLAKEMGEIRRCSFIVSTCFPGCGQ